MNDETIRHIQEKITQFGTDCWWTLDEKQLLPPKYQNEHHKVRTQISTIYFSTSLHIQYTKGKDTMDVWFDSGVSWDAAINSRGLPKSDVYIEGSDQYRGWFQSSLLTSGT